MGDITKNLLGLRRWVPGGLSQRMQALPPVRRASSWRAGRQLPRFGVLPVAAVLLVVFFAYLQPRFASVSNLWNIAEQGSILCIVALGQLFPVLGGGLDLSVGAVIALTSTVSALGMLGGGIARGIALGILVSAMVGLGNGLIVTYFKVSPLVVTLGMMSVVKSITLMLSNGQVIYGLPPAFKALGVSFVGPLPMTVIAAAITFLICYLILTWTPFGCYVCSIGGNSIAAYLSGIRVRRVKLLTYVACSVIAGVASILLTARLGSGQPNLGAGLDLDNFVAVFLGGARFGGGEGTPVGTLLGVIFVVTLANGLNLLNVPSYVQMAVIGLVLIVTLVSSKLQRPGRAF